MSISKNSIFSSNVISRVHDNELRFTSNQDIFTLFELFERMNNIIWKELEYNQNVNSFRRELQNLQIEMYANILFSNYDFNSDAQSMTRNSLKEILKNIYMNLSNPKYNLERI